MSFLVLKSLRSDSDKAMASFHLKQASAINDFRLILIAQIIMFLGFISYLFGVHNSLDIYREVGRLAGVVYAIIFVFVFSRWWYKFR